MAKKNNLFNIENEEKKQKKDNRNKKIKKDKHEKKKNNDKFSFDNEIIIGVTNIEKEEKEKEKQKNKKIKKKPIEKKENKKEKKKEIEKEAKKEKKIKNKKSVKKIKQKEKPLKVKKVKKEELIIQDIDEYELEKKFEERKKKIQKRLKIMRTISIILLIIAVILIVMFSPLFNIKEITIEGNELISKEQILSLSKLEKDTNIFSISKGKIRKNLKENQYIEDVEIFQNLPSTVTLKVTERKNSYIIEYANSFVVIDKKGYILEISDKKLDLPVIQGIETSGEEFVQGKRLNNKDLNKIFTITKIMDTANNNDMGSLITRIDIENEKSIKLIFEGEDKTAYIGNDSNLNIKLLTIKQILEKTGGLAGEIFVDMDLNSEYPMFRERV